MPKKKLTHSFIANLGKPEKRIDYADTTVKGLVLRVTPTGLTLLVSSARISSD